MRKRYLILHPDGSRRHIIDLEHADLFKAGRLTQVSQGIFRLRPDQAKISTNTFVNLPVPKALHSSIHAQIRLARISRAAGVHTQEQWIQRVEYFGWACRYCGLKLSKSTLTKDHQIPIADHGTEWASNLVPACKSCNSSKGVRRWRVSNSWSSTQMAAASM